MPFRVFLFAAACGVCLLALPQLPAPAEPQEVVEQIDFDALHGQATAALEALQQSHEQRVASTVNAAF